MKNESRNISLSAIRITLIYFVIATLWIAFTDRMLESLVSDSQYLSTLQTYKGWFYVFLTSVGLFYLIKKHDHQLESKDAKLAQTSSTLESKQELEDYSAPPTRIIQDVRRKTTFAPLLVIHFYQRKLLIDPLLKAGATGYLQNGIPESELFEAVNSVCSGSEVVVTESTD